MATVTKLYISINELEVQMITEKSRDTGNVLKPKRKKAYSFSIAGG